MQNAIHHLYLVSSLAVLQAAAATGCQQKPSDRWLTLLKQKKRIQVDREVFKGHLLVNT